MIDLLLTILASIGGTTIILGGLFGWLGKRHLDKILEAERSANKEKLALLQRDVSKEVEHLKSKLKFNEKFLENQLEASFKLYKIMKDIVPDKKYPEMDWCEACDQIAHDFEKTEKRLSEFLEAHYTTLPPEIYELLQGAEYLCSDGKLEIEGPEIPGYLNDNADKVFQNIKEACLKLKRHIDGQRGIIEPEAFPKKQSPNKVP